MSKLFPAVFLLILIASGCSGQVPKAYPDAPLVTTPAPGSVGFNPTPEFGALLPTNGPSPAPPTQAATRVPEGSAAPAPSLRVPLASGVPATAPTGVLGGEAASSIASGELPFPIRAAFYYP